MEINLLITAGLLITGQGYIYIYIYILSLQSRSGGAPHRGEPGRKARYDELLHAVNAEEPIVYTHIGYSG